RFLWIRSKSALRRSRIEPWSGRLSLSWPDRLHNPAWRPPMPTSSRIAERSAPVSVWILNAWKDLLLFVATPLLIVPVIALSRVRFSAEDIGLAVAAFGSQGHHLPGLLRAYGDRELFRRYRM